MIAAIISEIIGHFEESYEWEASNPANLKLWLQGALEILFFKCRNVSCWTESDVYCLADSTLARHQIWSVSPCTQLFFTASAAPTKESFVQSRPKMGVLFKIHQHQITLSSDLSPLKMLQEADLNPAPLGASWVSLSQGSWWLLVLI